MHRVSPVPVDKNRQGLSKREDGSVSWLAGDFEIKVVARIPAAA